MALSDLMKLVDDKLIDVFNKKPVDPVKARKPFLKALEKARKQFEEGKQPRGPAKWWEANNNIVILTPNVRGDAVEIGGKDRLAMPAERFLDALKIIEASTNAGELDEQLVKEDGEKAGNGSPRRRRRPMLEEAKAARRAQTAAIRGK